MVASIACSIPRTPSHTWAPLRNRCRVSSRISSVDASRVESRAVVAVLRALAAAPFLTLSFPQPAGPRPTAVLRARRMRFFSCPTTCSPKVVSPAQRASSCTNWSAARLASSVPNQRLATTIPSGVSAAASMRTNGSPCRWAGTRPLPSYASSITHCSDAVARVEIYAWASDKATITGTVEDEPVAAFVVAAGVARAVGSAV
mmetsp:Transcript_42775/g.112537  ORF Transcript_42775/g.112537 Transcript_42775/m.112537 type:complete len:202 (-) Transcript_42775:1883-2488(-)